MPWKETCVMDEKVKFIADYLDERYMMSELCQYYGISRKTGYKWLERYETDGVEGLKERSRRPHHHPQTTDAWIREQIIQTKLAHQSFGPKKVMDYLRREQPQSRWPADSTAGEILKGAGLVREKKRRTRISAHSQPFKDCHHPNAVWSSDFKGHFALGNRQRCYPLTVSDNDSRFILQCRGLTRTRQRDVRPWYEWIFREYGLPDAMRIDNGPPFASMALGGISELSKWWIQLGIAPERIKPGNPQQNGRHERMHRSLKAAVASPPKYNMRAQQQAFNRFVKEFNEQRSHEALDRKTPSQVYQPSMRVYPKRLTPVEYDQGIQVRHARHNGEIKWQGQLLYISHVLAKEPIGLKQVNEECWEIYFSFYLLGFYDERKKKVMPCRHWHGKKQ